MLEKIVFDEIYEYFSKNNLFHPSLHGYRKSRSTQTAMLQLYDKWVRAAASSKVFGAVLLNLSAAFDLVDPTLLLKKLKLYRVDDSVLQWLRSYLTERQQTVWIDHVYSDLLMSEVGVPQGSNLGPLLFLSFFNDLPSYLSCDAEAYADDTTLSCSGISFEEVGNRLSENCNKVSLWMAQNKLKLNTDKTHVLSLGTNRRLKNQLVSLEVTMDGVHLTQTDTKSETLLGCKIQSSLKWHEQIKLVLKKLKSRLGALEHIKYILPFDKRKTIVEGIFTSVLSYCLPVYGDCDQNELDALQILQKKAARIATCPIIRFQKGHVDKASADVSQTIGLLPICTYNIPD